MIKYVARYVRRERRECMSTEKSVGFLLKQIHNNINRILNNHLKEENLTLSNMSLFLILIFHYLHIQVFFYFA